MQKCQILFTTNVDYEFADCWIDVNTTMLNKHCNYEQSSGDNGDFGVIQKISTQVDARHNKQTTNIRTQMWKH